MDKLCETDPWYTEMKRHRNEENMRTLIADGDFGFPPPRCPCGGKIIEEFATSEPRPIGRKYLTCNEFKNDGLHIRKCWELAVEEEPRVLNIRTEKEFMALFQVNDFAIKQLRKEVEEKAEEIARLNELVARLKARIEKLFGPQP